MALTGPWSRRASAGITKESRTEKNHPIKPSIISPVVPEYLKIGTNTKASRKPKKPIIRLNRSKYSAGKTEADKELEKDSPKLSALAANTRQSKIAKKEVIQILNNCTKMTDTFQWVNNSENRFAKIKTTI